jgi:PAS domain S-box-containing protein
MYDLTMDAQLHFKKLLQINGGSSSVIRLYATFVMHTMNDPWRGQSLLNYAKNIDKENEREMKKMKKEMNEIARQGKDMNFFVSSIKPSDLENEKNVFFTLSAENSTIGTILDCKGDIEGVFGFRRRDVINKNITLVIPEPFAAPHDELLRKYLRDGRGEFMGKTRLAPGLHKDGYLIQMALTLRESLSSEHPTFLGIVQRGDMFGEVLIIDSEFVVTASSQGCSTIFDYNLSELKTRSIHATELFPGFDDKDERDAMNGSRITLNGEAFNVIIAPSVMPLVGQIYLVKMIPVMDAIGTVKAESSRMSSVHEEEEEEDKSEEYKGEDKSVTSSTGMSTRNFFSSIRSLRDKVDPNMLKLKQRSIFTLLLVIVTIITASSFISVFVGELQDVMRSVQDNILREEYIATTYSLTRQLDWHESGVLPNLPNNVYNRLVSDMGSLDLITSEINKKYTNDNMKNVQHLDSDPDLEVYIPVGSKTEIEYKGLWDLVLEYLTKVEVVIEETDITNNNRIDSINYIALNGPGSLKDGAFTATDHFTESHHKIETRAQMILQYLAIVFIVVVAVLFLMGIRTIHRLYLLQERMFGMFLKISRSDVVRIQSIVKKTISKLKGSNITDGSFHNHGNDSSDDSDEDEEAKRKKKLDLHGEEERDVDTQVKKTSSFSRLIAASFSAKSHTWLLSLIGKFSFFFIIPLLFILFEFFYSRDLLHTNSLFTDEVRICGMRSTIMHEIHYTLQDFVVADKGSTEANSSYYELLHLSRELKELEHGFIFGGHPYYHLENIKTSHVKSKQAAILYGDACNLMTSTGHNCTSFDDGLLVNGLHGALVEYMYLTSRVAYMRDDLNMSINATFLSDEYRVVEQLSRIYLSEILMEQTAVLNDEVITHLDTHKSEATIINVIAGLVVTLSYLFYRANANRLENILKHNRSLPLIIPVEIAPRIKALKEYMKSVRKDMER